MGTGAARPRGSPDPLAKFGGPGSERSAWGGVAPGGEKDILRIGRRRWRVCSLWLASTALVLWGGPLAGGVSVQPHPLDPLTREELAAAVEILAASGRTNAGSRLALIALREPAKQDVLGFVPGLPVRREAFVVVYERVANRTFEAAIDLGARQVHSWTEIPGVQPAILTEEYALTGAIVRHDAR